jgi:hypothetical protein
MLLAVVLTVVFFGIIVVCEIPTDPSVGAFSTIQGVACPNVEPLVYRHDIAVG